MKWFKYSPNRVLESGMREWGHCTIWSGVKEMTPLRVLVFHPPTSPSQSGSRSQWGVISHCLLSYLPSHTRAVYLSTINVHKEVGHSTGLNSLNLSPPIGPKSSRGTAGREHWSSQTPCIFSPFLFPSSKLQPFVCYEPAPMKKLHKMLSDIIDHYPQFVRSFSTFLKTPRDKSSCNSQASDLSSCRTLRSPGGS